MTKPKILFFDSGIGGLSVYLEVRKVLANADFFYLFDHECFPYGSKSEVFLQNRVKDLLEKAYKKLHFDLVVIACNTASTTVLPKIREFFSIPVVGVVPAIKPAAKLSKKKIIALLATPGTVNRAYTDFLINEFAYDCKVLKIGSEKLVRLAEDSLTVLTDKLNSPALSEELLTNQQLKSNHDVVNIEQSLAFDFQLKDFNYQILQEILDPITSLPKQEQPDVVILGCTHFPLVKAQIAHLLGDKISLIDSGQAIGRRVLQLLGLLVSNHHLSCSLSYSCEDLESNSLDPKHSTLDQKTNLQAFYTGYMSDQDLDSFKHTFSLFGFNHLQRL